MEYVVDIETVEDFTASMVYTHPGDYLNYLESGTSND